MRSKLTYTNLFLLFKFMSLMVIIFAVSLTVVNVAMRWYIGNLIDTLQAGRIQEFGWISLGIITLLFIGLSFALPYSKTRLINRLQEKLYFLLESKALSADQGRLDGVDIGEGSTYFTSDVGAVVRYVNRMMGVGIPDIFTFVSAAVLLCSINLQLGLIGVLVSVIPALFMFFMSRILVYMNAKYQEGVKEINQKTSNYFYNFEFVKANTLEREIDRENEGLLNDLLRKKKSLSFREAILSFPTMVSSFLTVLVLSIYGGYLVVQGKILIGELFTVITLVDYIVSPVMRFRNTVSEIRRVKVNLDRINGFLALTDEKGEAFSHIQISEKSPWAFLQISNLWFKYPNGKRVFEGMDFSWERGKLHVIIGENGAGKSTLLKIIAGIYTPQKGKILVSGIRTEKKITLEDYREQIVIDTQRTVIFPGTVRYNLTLGHRISQDKIDAVCKAVGLYQEIDGFSQRYETVLDMEGNPLSGGQKRRLCLARSLLRESSIYIFDEPTTGIDPQNIQSIITSLQNIAKERLVIVITHEPLVIQKADTITKLEANQAS